MKLVLIGIQGSGKGTQARKLADKYSFKIFETGKVLREIATKDTELGRTVKSNIDNGRHVSPKIVEDILENILKENKGENIILDGFSRNEGNKKSIDKIVGDYKVLFFNLSEKKAKNRLLGRMYDKETGETFSAGTVKNPKNGNTLIKRVDDEESAINERIRLFYEVTMLIVEEHKKDGNLIEIDADGSIEEVFYRVEKGLDL